MSSWFLETSESSLQAAGLAEQVTLLKARIEEDDRYALKPFVAGPSTVCTYCVREKKENRVVKGDKVSLTLDTETIPQFVWPAAAPFAEWIVRNPERFRGLHVLELGSGVGLAGLAAASVGAKSVTLTDCSAVSLAMIGIGIQHTAKTLIDRRDGCNHLYGAELKWGSAPTVHRLVQALDRRMDPTDESATNKDGFAFDVVIGCDIFYFNTSLKSGLTTAAAALRGDTAAPLGEKSSLPSTKSPKTFYCASFVRSERMDVDIEALPQLHGFNTKVLEDCILGSHAGKVGREGQEDATDEESKALRLYEWTLV